MFSDPGSGAAASDAGGHPMAGDAAIRVRGLSKCYQIYDRPQDRLKQSIVPLLSRFVGATSKPYFREFWALRDISFEVARGETVGIIGRNGSGKSTLLQVVCGTLAPTGGSVETRGRIAALLELGSGFNPDFTGRENVYMNGAILGMSQAEIESRFDDIAAFAGIGDFMNQPVKFYSSGMFVRLAFAVNIMSRPEIMIVDEALAVGDMNFQARCMTALTRLQENGATILFVSHDIGAVKSLCSRAVYLEKGQVIASGAAGDVAELYVRNMRQEMNEEYRRSVRTPPVGVQQERASASPSSAALGRARSFMTSAAFDERVAPFRYGTGEARIGYVELLDSEGNEIVEAQFDQEVMVRIHFTSLIDATISPLYYVLDDRKLLILGAGPRQAGASLVEAKAGEQFVATYRTRLPLQEGNYSVQCQLSTPEILDETATFFDVIDDAIVFRVARKPSGRIWAKVYLANTVDVQPFGRAT